MTNDLIRRVWEHKEGLADGHTKKYRIKRLVHYEVHATAEAAIKREKQLKRWRRAWKDDPIEAGNRDWRDLYDDIAKPGAKIPDNRCAMSGMTMRDPLYSQS